MPESPFPDTVPKVGDLVRVTPVTVDLVVRNYKFFCQESHVASRFYALDYADRKYIEVWLGGTMVQMIRFNLESSTWSTSFDGQDIQLEVEVILE